MKSTQCTLKKVCAVLVVVIMALGLVSVNAVYDEATVIAAEDGSIDTIYSLTGKYLSDNNKSISYGDGKEGYLLGLSRAAYPVDAGLYSGYYDSVRSYLASNGGQFDSVTECAKVVTVLNAIGYDPTNVDSVDITTQLEDADNVSGVWGYAYTLIGLDSKNYPSNHRELYISKLLEAQLDNGAWGWDGETEDIDTTGMVLASLAPYYNNNATVREAVDNAINYLSDVQMEDGTFSSFGTKNSNTTAMVVLGLSELGIDASSDERFVKGGISAVDALGSFAVEGGGFGWDNNTEINDYATYQSYYALNSYYRQQKGMKRLFDMTPDEESNSGSNAVSEDAAVTDVAKETTDAAESNQKVTKAPKTGDKWLLVF